MLPLRGPALQRPPSMAATRVTLGANPGPSTFDDDTALVAQWRMGSHTAGLLLVRRQVTPTRSYFARRVPCAADLDDLVQRTLLTSIEALPRFRGDTTFSGFVHAIANKLLLRYRRDTKRARDRIDEGLHPDALAAGDPPVTACMSHKDTRDRLRRALRALPHTSARLLLLRYWGEQDVEDIGRELGLKPGAVRARLHRARQDMMRALAPKASAKSDVWPMDDV
jgi:RNA polymerase sigma factor (sigma-70 family)